MAWWSGGLVLAGLSLGGVPELVIQVANLSLTPRQTTPSSLAVNGLETFYELLNIDGSVPCLVLRPRKSVQHEVFFALADHVVSQLQTNIESDGRAETLEALLKQWMDFWSKDASVFSVEKLLGLIGELLAIKDWLDLNGQKYTFWTGPQSLPQDFRGSADAVEVKVLGKRTGARVHRISSTLQLQDMPNNGRLYVLSYRLALSSSGSYSVHELVDTVRSLDLFKESDARLYFEDALLSAGYTRDLPLNVTTFDLVQQGLYTVAPDFPRLINDLLPSDSRILDVEYSIDLSACDEYLVAETPFKLELL